MKIFKIDLLNLENQGSIKGGDISTCLIPEISIFTLK